jgi:hypothetical protein
VSSELRWVLPAAATPSFRTTGGLAEGKTAEGVRIFGEVTPVAGLSVVVADGDWWCRRDGTTGATQWFPTGWK